MMVRLTPIVDRLRGAGFRQVEGLLELSRQDAAPRQLPALFVVPTAERASASVNVGARDQAIDTGFSVIVVLDGARRDQAGISEQLTAECRRIVGAVAGWTHPDAARACDYVGGRLLSASGSTVEWTISFTTRQHLRKPS